MQQSEKQYQKLLTEIIKKQIIILGPTITLAKARNIKGITVSEDGTVTAILGNPQELIQQLVDQFIELSDLIVKKTIEPMLTNHSTLTPPIQPSQTSIISGPAPSSRITISASQPIAPLPAPLQDSINTNQKPTTNSDQ